MNWYTVSWEGNPEKFKIHTSSATSNNLHPRRVNDPILTEKQIDDTANNTVKNKTLKQTVWGVKVFRGKNSCQKIGLNRKQIIIVTSRQNKRQSKHVMGNATISLILDRLEIQNKNVNFKE